MSTENLTGKFDQLKGKIKQTVGEATNNDRLANSGVADQVKGNVKEAWGNTKDAAHSISSDARANVGSAHEDANRDPAGDNAAHNVRDGIVSAARSAKNAIVHDADEVKANR